MALNLSTLSGSSVAAYSATIPAASKQYRYVNTFNAGVYTITTNNSSVSATVNFFNATGEIVTAYTTSGTVTVSLASGATGAFIRTDSGTNILVTFTQIANNAITPEISGTLDTITTSGTYSQTGNLYVLCVGGGAAGMRTGANNSTIAGGGGPGAIVGKYVVTSTSQTITIGAGATSSASALTASNGSATSFGSLVTASGGTTSPADSYSNGSESPNYWTTIKTGTTGGGGSGGNWAPNAPKSGAGSGIGTGGNGGASGSAGGNGTGYGAGGGGGGGNTSSSQAGGSGTAGVVYILRGF